MKISLTNYYDTVDIVFHDTLIITITQKTFLQESIENPEKILTTN